MKTAYLLALAPVVASCHFDKLFSGGGGTRLSHDPPAGLAFASSPGTARAGQPLGLVRVAVVDSAGTPVAGADTILVTIAIKNNPGGGTLTGTDTAHVVNGVATFSDLRIDQAGTAYTPTTGDLTVTTTTGGTGSDPNGYTVTVDAASKAITVNGSVTFPGLAAGDHSVQLGGVASNCVVSGQNPRTISVPAGGANQTTFAITCTAPANQPPAAAFSSSCNQLDCAFTSTSSDPDGTITAYSWTFGDGGTATTQNPSHTYGAAGAFTVTLTVTDNQNATAIVSHTVTVTAPPVFNQPPVVTAGPDQNPVVGLVFTLSGASFSDPDHDGPWNVTIDWGDGSQTTFGTSSEGSIGGSHSYAGVAFTQYTLTVTVVDAHGNRGSASKTVTVTLL
ncbi:MAG: hypothetical protein DMD60_04715 [Gemmatimonadetes bacterium]|nr:MAG: hypothetical protein DMD60_04715 [Gemmatimonadota bacterium]